MAMREVGNDLDLTCGALYTETGSQFGSEHLDRYLTVVLEILGEVDTRHPTATEFTLDGVVVGECCFEAFQEVRHSKAPSTRSLGVAP